MSTIERFILWLGILSASVTFAYPAVERVAHDGLSRKYLREWIWDVGPFGSYWTSTVLAANRAVELGAIAGITAAIIFALRASRRS